jgi:cell division protein FtsL
MAAIGARQAGVLGDIDWRVRRPLGKRAARSSRGYRLRRVSSRRRAASLSLVLVMIAVSAMLAALYLTQSSRIASTGYEIERLEARLDQLEAERQALLLQVGQAESPATIESRAAELGLTPLPGASVHFAKPLSDRHP